MVDYWTQRRIPKDSALMYRDVIAANAVDDGP
jgi:beta-glucosidase